MKKRKSDQQRERNVELAGMIAQSILRTMPAIILIPVSASLDRRSENIRVLQVIISELDLGNIGKTKVTNYHLSTNPRSMV